MNRYDESLSEVTTKQLPPAGVKSKVIEGLLRHLGWKDVIIVYKTDEDSLSFLEHFLLEVSTDFVQFQTVPFHSAWTSRGLPSIIKVGPDGASQRLDILVLCDLACAKIVLQGASSFEDRLGPTTILRMASRWLVALTGYSTPYTKEFANVSMDNVLVVDLKNLAYIGMKPSESSVCCLASTLMWRQEGRELSHVGHATYNGEVKADAECFPNTKFGLNGRKMKVASTQWAGFVVMTSPDGEQSFEGPDYDYVRTLALTLNFTIEVVLSPVGSFGSPLGNGSWSGVIGKLQKREADLSMSGLVISKDRWEVVDFSNAMAYGYYGFLHRTPDGEPPKWMTYLKPLKWRVILCSGIAMVIMAVFNGIVEIVSSQSEAQGRRHIGFFLRRFADSFQVFYGALFLQSSTQLPLTSPGRLLISFWWLFCVIMAATYTGNLVAFLTVTKGEFPVQTFEDLVNQDGYKWGVVGHTEIHNVLKNSNLSVFRRIWEGLLRFNKTDGSTFGTDDQSHVQKALTNDYIFIADNLMLEMLTDMTCGVEIGKAKYLTITFCLGFPKHSAYAKLFSEKIDIITSSGLYSVWQDVWQRKTGLQQCPGREVIRQRPASVADLQSAFYVLLIGGVGSCGLLVLELVIKKIKS